MAGEASKFKAYVINTGNGAGQGFESVDEAIRQAKLWAGAENNSKEFIVFVATKVIRPIPKEVEVVEIKS